MKTYRTSLNLFFIVTFINLIGGVGTFIFNRLSLGLLSTQIIPFFIILTNTFLFIDVLSGSVELLMSKIFALNRKQAYKISIVIIIFYAVFSALYAYFSSFSNVIKLSNIVIGLYIFLSGIIYIQRAYVYSKQKPIFSSLSFVLEIFVRVISVFSKDIHVIMLGYIFSRFLGIVFLSLLNNTFLVQIWQYFKKIFIKSLWYSLKQGILYILQVGGKVVIFYTIYSTLLTMDITKFPNFIINQNAIMFLVFKIVLFLFLAINSTLYQLVISNLHFNFSYLVVLQTILLFLGSGLYAIPFIKNITLLVIGWAGSWFNFIQIILHAYTLALFISIFVFHCVKNLFNRGCKYRYLFVIALIVSLKLVLNLSSFIQNIQFIHIYSIAYWSITSLFSYKLISKIKEK